MKLSGLLPALALLWLPASEGLAAPAGKPQFNICYFSLNKEDEFEITKDFMNKLNVSSGVQINVLEFLPDKSTVKKKGNESDGNYGPNAFFKKMVESGTKCDGLVISGHHTYSYGGKRAFEKQNLEMEFMEKLSCDPKYAEFFRSINAVWLQGCRTLGVGTIVAGQEDNIAYNPEYHTGRVGTALIEDNLGQDFAQLNTEFTNTLDQDNPLSSRYLRLFPAAKLFGWTKTAPGEKANSQYSMLYHIAHMSRAMSSQNEFPKESPLSPVLSADSVARYADSVLLALAQFSEKAKRCEEIATTAWTSHGSKRPGNDRYSYDNADLAALTSLNSAGNEALKTMKLIECRLKAAGQTGDLTLLHNVLDSLIARPDLIPYATNSIVDLRNQLLDARLNRNEDYAQNNRKSPEQRKTDAALAENLLDKMKTHPTIVGFLESKVKSKQLGLLRKIDFYRFYNLLTGKKIPEVEADIEAKMLEEFRKPLPRTSQSERRLAMGFRRLLMESGFKNKVLGEQTADAILALNPEWDVLASLGSLIAYVPVKDKIALLDRMATFPQRNRPSLRALLDGTLSIAPKGEYDPIYARAHKKYWVEPENKINDYWHGDIPSENLLATRPEDVPPVGSLGGPPAIVGVSTRPITSAPPTARVPAAPRVIAPSPQPQPPSGPSLDDLNPFNLLKRVFQ